MVHVDNLFVWLFIPHSFIYYWTRFGFMSKCHDWTSSAGLLSKRYNWCENTTGCIPPATLQCLAAKSHCLLNTWLESSSEVWSSTIWREEEDRGPLSGGNLLFLLPKPAFCISRAPRDGIKVDTFLLCFEHTATAAKNSQGPIGGRDGHLWMRVGRMQ